MIKSILMGMISPITDKVFGVVEKYLDKQITKEEIRGKVAEAVLQSVDGMSEAQAKVLIAEAQGQSWLQRNWRPLSATSFAFTLVYYALIGPQLYAWVGLPVGNPGDLILEWMFTLTMTFGSVYAGGRTVEKVVDNIVKNR